MIEREMAVPRLNLISISTSSTTKHTFSANPRLVVGLFETPFQSFEFQSAQATYVLFSGFAIWFFAPSFESHHGILITKGVNKASIDPQSADLMEDMTKCLGKTAG